MRHERTTDLLVSSSFLDGKTQTNFQVDYLHPNFLILGKVQQKSNKQPQTI